MRSQSDEFDVTAADLQINAQVFIEQIERQIAKLDDHPGQCLYYAHHTAVILRRHGYRAVIQAGSMQWPRIPKGEDDGAINTHFAYEWRLHDPMSAVSVAIGNLPEMHVWVGLLTEQEIVDFSTRHLQTQCAMTGLEWTAADPPQYLWCHGNDLPDWVGYRADRDATLYACGILQKLYKPAYLRK